MYQPQLASTKRQITIAVLLSLVYQHTAWAVHRLDSVFLAINLSKIHIFLVMSPVTGTLPQLTIQNHRCADFLITITAMYLTPVINQLIADNHTIWMEEWEAWAFLMNAKEIQLLAQLAMVTLGSFLQHLQISIQIILLFKGSTIDTLQHLVLFTATPVSTSHALQLQSLYLACRNYMRACTKVSKLTLNIQRNLCILWQIINQLYLVVLTSLGEHIQSFLTANQLTLQLQVLLDNLMHFLLDFLQILIGKAFLHVNIIVEPIFNSRANSQLNIFVLVQTLHSLSKNMRCSMTEGMTSPFILKGQKLNSSILVQYCCQIHNFIINTYSQNLLSQAVADRLYQLQGSNTCLCFSDRSIRHSQFNHSNPPVFKEIFYFF